MQSCRPRPKLKDAIAVCKVIGACLAPRLYVAHGFFGGLLITGESTPYCGSRPPVWSIGRAGQLPFVLTVCMIGRFLICVGGFRHWGGLVATLAPSHPRWFCRLLLADPRLARPMLPFTRDVQLLCQQCVLNDITSDSLGFFLCKQRRRCRSDGATKRC